MSVFMHVYYYITPGGTQTESQVRFTKSVIYFLYKLLTKKDNVMNICGYFLQLGLTGMSDYYELVSVCGTSSGGASVVS